MTRGPSGELFLTELCILGHAYYPIGVCMVYRANPSDGVGWVTGASSGIGQGAALELARRGYRVFATARR